MIRPRPPSTPARHAPAETSTFTENISKTERDQELPIPTLVTTILVLLVLAALSQPLAERLRLPLAAVLATAGLAFAGFATWAATSLAHAPVGEMSRQLIEMPISSELFLYILLPILLYQGAVGIDVRHLARDSAAVFLLAILAVLASIALIGGAMHLASGLGLTACLLLGAIVATTDPSAVIAMFRELGAPPRLTRLVEGESLLNDATAIAAFTVLLTALLSGSQPSAPELALQLAGGFIAGACLGIAGGLLLMHALERMRQYRPAQLTATLVTPYAVFLIGDLSPYVSGVVAVVVSGITLGFVGRSRFDRADFRFLHELLDQFATWATGLIFILAALLVPRLLSGASWHDLLLVGCVTAAALAARAAVLWGLAPILAMLGLMRPITHRMNTALLWGGLRGAMTLALVLSISETSGLAEETRRTIGIVATGYTLFTLLVQGTTLRLVIRGLGLTRLTSVETAFRGQALSETITRTTERVSAFARRAGLPEDLVNSAMAPYHERLTKAAETSLYEDEISDKEKVRLGLSALISRERNLLLEQRWSSGLPSTLTDQYLYSLDRMRDEARGTGRVGYLRAARAPYLIGMSFRFVNVLHSSLGIQRPLASHLGRRFHYLLVNRIMVMQLHWYAQASLKPIFGERITDILVEILSRRREEIERHLDAIRLQYPDFAQALEASMVTRYAHHEEGAQIRELRDAGVIAPGIAASLTEEAEAIYRGLRRPGRVDLLKPKPDLLKSLRAFEGFSDQQLRKAARNMKSVVFPANTRIYGPGDRVDYIYFIANGAVEVRRGDDDVTRLGRGQAFGQLRVLNPEMKPAEVTSISYSHCFRMRVRDFRTLIREAPVWRRDIVSEGVAALPGE